MQTDTRRHLHRPAAARVVCADCNHPEHLHVNSMCGVAHCYCRAFVAPDAVAGLVGASGSVHPFPRGLADREHRQRLLRLVSVPAVDVGERRRARAAVAGSAAGADLPGVAGVATRRRLLAGMGNRARVRAPLTLSFFASYGERSLRLQPQIAEGPG